MVTFKKVDGTFALFVSPAPAHAHRIMKKEFGMNFENLSQVKLYVAHTQQLHRQCRGQISNISFQPYSSSVCKRTTQSTRPWHLNSACKKDSGIVFVLGHGWVAAK